jgi:hypothetical protein
MSGRMLRALVLFAVLLLFAPPALGRMPELNVKAICESRSADAKMMHSVPLESTADCVRNEEAAKQGLSTLWASTSAPIRNRCESDARSLGTTSYLDLLTCIQITEDEDMKLGPKKKTGKQ